MLYRPHICKFESFRVAQWQGLASSWQPRVVLSASEIQLVGITSYLDMLSYLCEIRFFYSFEILGKIQYKSMPRRTAHNMKPYLSQVFALGISKPSIEVEQRGNHALFLLHPYEMFHSKVSTRM